jgi:hypothetical protein
VTIEGDGDGAEGVLGHGFVGFSTAAAASWQLSAIGEVQEAVALIKL